MHFDFLHSNEAADTEKEGGLWRDHQSRDLRSFCIVNHLLSFFIVFLLIFIISIEENLWVDDNIMFKAIFIKLSSNPKMGYKHGTAAQSKLSSTVYVSVAVNAVSALWVSCMCLFWLQDG